MTTLVVPALDAEPWPTLGPQVCDCIEAYAVFGPGDLLGMPARLDDEKRALLWRMYEVYPPHHHEVLAGRIEAGRRRFKRCAISLQKGSAKSEFAAWIVYVELHPEGPVRCDGFDGSGNPVGRPIVDPYIPMLAYTEEQTEELAYRALYEIVGRGPCADLFDVGLQRIMRKDGDGKAEAVAASPNAVDGRRTSHQHFDETHRLWLPQKRESHRVMLQNIPKRYHADAWSLETTTAYRPGMRSVAEDTHAYALDVAAGKIKDGSRLFFFHRQASGNPDRLPDDVELARAGVIEAAGAMASWKDITSIVAELQDPHTDVPYWVQVWWNQPTQAGSAAFDIKRWEALSLSDLPPDLTEGLEWRTEGIRPKAGELISLGFDGSRYHDATGIVGTHLRTGYQWTVGVWERPLHAPADWQVPEPEVHATMGGAFHNWVVKRLYADPPYWEDAVAHWAGEYGTEIVAEFRTNRVAAMAYAVRGYHHAIVDGHVRHDGDQDLARHIGNARRRLVNVWDEQDKSKQLWVVIKERKDSPRKIDLAVCAVLSWEARTDAIAAGALADGGPSIYETQGLFI